MNLREILPEEFFKEWGENMKEYRMLATEVIVLDSKGETIEEEAMPEGAIVKFQTKDDYTVGEFIRLEAGSGTVYIGKVIEAKKI